MRLALLSAVVVLGLVGPEAQAQGPRTEDEKTLYAIGYSLGQGIKVYDLSPAELELVRKAMADALSDTPPAVDLARYGPKAPALSQARQIRAEEKVVERAAREKGATRLPSGLVYKELKAGSGPSPRATDTVTVHYRGTLTSGKEFDSSYVRNSPSTFPLQDVIPCWTEGLQRMKVGGRAQLFCPAKLAYGEKGSRPNVPPNATLIFEVELLGIQGAGGK